MGIIVNETNAEDILYYNEEFKKINEIFGDKVKLIFYGYKKDEDKLNILDGVTYDYIKPVSIIHYFKQLKALELDLLFIPLISDIKAFPIQTKYNVTSENYNKFLEVGIFKVPILTVNTYPYNLLLKDNMNAFIYPSKEVFIEYFKDLIEKKQAIIKLCGSHVYDLVTKDFNFSVENIKLLSSVFSIPKPKNIEQPQH